MTQTAATRLLRRSQRSTKVGGQHNYSGVRSVIITSLSVSCSFLGGRVEVIFFLGVCAYRRCAALVIISLFDYQQRRVSATLRDLTGKARALKPETGNLAVQTRQAPIDC